MRVLRRPSVLLAGLLFLAAAFWGLTDRVYGQAVTPSADQIDMFRNLSPDQQDAILKQLGGGGGAGGLSGLGSSSSSADRQGQANQRDNQDNIQGRSRRGTDEEPEPLIPVLKAEDWVVIEIDFHLTPRTTSQAAGQSPLTQ